jgi:dienelactone hydrolase
LCSACGGGANISKSPQYDFPPKENVVADGQYYTGIEEVSFPSRLWSAPIFERAPQYDREDVGVEAYFLQSVEYNGAPTNVFAFVGIPESATADKPAPGIVLVHGGGGTAFADWVKMWKDRGYAAIAIDTAGRIPTGSASLTSGANHSTESIKHHGPDNTSYADCEKPAEEQYLYHAIAATVVANSFLSSLDRVDGSRIGLTGISGGGVIATNAAAYDDRFAFVAPVYGAVAMTGTDRIFGELYATHPRCSELWDNVEMLRSCRTPILFVNWDDDPYFAPDATEKCMKAAMNARMILIPDLNHGHWNGANIQEIFDFADSVLQIG